MIAWFKRFIAWQAVRDTGVWRYEENAVTGERRAVRTGGGGYQPLSHWVDGRAFDWRPPPPHG